MKRANADLYYHNSAENVTGLAAVWCQWRRRVFIYSVASDVACERKLPAMRGMRDRVLYRYGLRHATRIIVQTHRQGRLLKESFRLDSVPLPMPCRLPVAFAFKENATLPPVRVVWVGRIDRMKRMEWILDIAERMPNIEFDIVGANLGLALSSSRLAAYADHLFRRARSIGNIAFHGTLPREELPELYRSALCLCCTSTYEGFPNTFLEAWSQGTPVVSSFDPDGLIQSHNLGCYACRLDDFVSGIQRLSSSADEWQRKSRNCLEYYATTHSLVVAMPRFEREIVDTYRHNANHTGSHWDI